MWQRGLRRGLTAGQVPGGLKIFAGTETEVPQILVTRPQKGVFWGKGGQYVKVQKVVFKKGQLPSIRRLLRFLEAELVEDLKVVDMSQYTQNHICSTAITGVGQTPRHISKVFSSLIKSLKDSAVPGVEHLSNPACRTSEWQMMSLKDLFVHIMTREYQAQMDLERALKNPPSKEDVKKLDLDVFQQYYNKGRPHQ